MKYVMLDRLLEGEPFKHARGVRGISFTEDVLQTHFPNFPIVPGVLLLEALVQVAQAGALPADQAWELTEVRRAKFRRYVRPGDRLVSEVTLRKHEGDTASFSGELTVDGQPVVSVQTLVLKLHREAEGETRA